LHVNGIQKSMIRLENQTSTQLVSRPASKAGLLLFLSSSISDSKSFSFAVFAQCFLLINVVFYSDFVVSLADLSSREGQLPISSFRSLISTLVGDNITELFSGTIS